MLFSQRHIQYLGHLISADGIQPLPEKLESIAKMPAPKKPKRSETIPRASRLQQKIRSQIRRHLKSTNTFSKKGCRIQMDTRVWELFPDIERIPAASTNTQRPQPSSQLHILHKCIQIHICGHIDTNTTMAQVIPSHMLADYSVDHS